MSDIPPLVMRLPALIRRFWARFRSLALLVGGGSPLFAVSCNDPKRVVLARFLGDAGAPNGEAPPAEAGGGNGGGGAIGGGGDAGATRSVDRPGISARRGRVKVVEGVLVSDIGTPLRGALLPVDTGWKLTDFDMIAEIAETSGLNTLHVFLEDTTQATGVAMAQADALVSLAAQSGMYVAIGIGTGVGATSTVGKIDQPKINDFWSLYAPRYANQSHVLFEIQNNPEVACNAPFSNATVNAERDTYALIRRLAPASHIMLFSTTSLVEPAVLNDAVARLGPAVDWSNASFAMDITSPCLAPTEAARLAEAAKALGVAIFVSQLDRDDWAEEISAFEPLAWSWSHFRWFVNSRDVPSFRRATTAAGLTWCPDQGLFPQDATRCR